MKRKDRHISYYYKYLLSYIAILIIPILFLALYVDVRIFETLENEVITNDVNTLHQVKNGIESHLIQLQKIRNEIYMDTNKSSFYFKEDPMQAVQRIDELRAYQVTNPYLTDIFLYYCGDDYIYTSTGSCRLELMMKDFFHYEDWDYDDFYHTINTIQQPMFRSVEGVKLSNNTDHQYATMIYPLRESTAAPYAMLMFIMPKEFFDSRMHHVIDNHAKMTVVMDDTDKIIVSSQHASFLYTDKFKRLITSTNRLNKTVIELEQKKYIAAFVQSDETGWTYITLSPQENIALKTKHVRRGFIYGILLVIGMGFLAIFISMRINYNPIKKLKNYSASIIHHVKGSKGELDVVKEAIDFLSDQNALLTDEVEHSSEASRQYMTMQILRGSMPLHDQVQKKAEKYGVLIHDYCTVAILYVNNNTDGILTRQGIIQMLKKAFSPTVNIYACEHFDCRKIIMILSFKELGDAALTEPFKDVQKAIKERFNISTAVGIGHCYEDKKLIPKAYIEASTAVDYRLIKGNGCVILFRDIMEQQIALASYPQENLKNITHFLKAGKIKEIEKELDHMVSYIKNNNTPIFIVRGLCFDIINQIFQTSQEMVNAFDNHANDVPDVFTLSKYDTVDELAAVAKDLSHDLCTQIIQQKEKEELSLIRDMVIYIKENYSDCCFSLQVMADHFNMSQSSLSMYFKDKTEQTILNYITRIKMDKAKELLISTEIPLSKLSLEVGYSNVTSFIRRFKQWEGITPGEYRKKYV